MALPATAVPPRVKEAPSDVVTNEGGAASFRAVLDEHVDVSYQWLHNDRPVAGGTGATLVIPLVSSADAGRYEVMLRTATDMVSGGSAVLTVRPPPTRPIVDPTFRADLATRGTPSVVLPLEDGRVLLATSVRESSWDLAAHAKLYRLLPDGRIDPAFMVSSILGEEFPRKIDGVVSPPEPPVIRQLLVQPDGRVIVVGNFSFINGVAHGGIARLNPDGTLDETFRTSHRVLNDPSLFHYSTVAALRPDGKILVLVSSSNQSTALRRLERDGRDDPTFAPSGVPTDAKALALGGDGRIFIGSGHPRGPGGNGRVIAFSSEGELDATFAPFPCDPVRRLYALENGSVMVTTQYDRGPILPGGPITGPRFPQSTFRLRADGSKDPAFATRSVALTTPPANDGTLFLGGKLIGPDGSTETTPRLGVPSQAQDITSYTLGRDGRLWAVGTFSFFNGVSSSRVARLNLDASENLTTPRVLAAWADKPVVKLNESVTLRVAPVGDGPLTYTWLWPFNSGVFAVTNEPTLEVPGSTAHERITYTVRVENSAGAVTSQGITVTNEPGELRIAWQPRRVALTSGRWAAVSVQLASGALPSDAEWRRNGERLSSDTSGATGIVLGIAQPSHAGTYVVTFRDKLGRTVVSDPIIVTVDDSARFTNLSTRGLVGSGEREAILGFVIPPGQNRGILLRGVGPGLSDFGVTGELADPRLDLFDGAGRVVNRNDDWQVFFTGNSGFARVGAFPLAPGRRDTALRVELPPGSYTVKLASLSAASGIGLIELYEDDNVSDRLANLSSRVFVTGDADGIAIAGFAVRGPVDKRVLVRAAGPALAGLGVTNPVADPHFEIRDVEGTQAGSNEDWHAQSDAAGVASAAASVGAFPFLPGSKDAALVQMLPPGNYSVLVNAKSGEAGIALIEIYEVP